MVSTVTTRPNHYEVLGLTPEASDEEIARAFAREAGPYRPRPIGELARITLAYETLRDPAKRRAYDVSLAPKIAPEPVPTHWPRDGWPFVPTVRARPSGRPAIDESRAPERQANPAARPVLVEGMQTAPFIAASPPDLAKPDARNERPSTQRAEPEPPRPPERHEPPAVKSHASALDYRLDERFRDIDSSPIEWWRPALAAGGLFLAVALIGAWLGWTSGNEAQDVLPEEAVTLKVPDAAAGRPAVASPSAAAPTVAEVLPEQRAIAEAAPARIAQPSPAVPEPDVREEQQADSTLPEQGRMAEIAAGLAIAESPTVEAAPSALPLPDAVVARTIRRIGYACGDVASITAVDGAAAGVFKVTCTSGESYRAAPIRGRYHFRRWGRD